MSKYQITIELDNDAFVPDQNFEIVRILATLNRHIGDYGITESRTLKDTNGNYVGIAHLIEG